MRKFFASLLFVAVLAAIPAHADPRAELVVTPAWLAQHAADKDLVILHAGNAASFQTGHIPGAHLADLDQISVSDPQGLSTELPSAEILYRQLEALGISDNSRVVVYVDAEAIPRAGWRSEGMESPGPPCRDRQCACCARTSQTAHTASGNRGRRFRAGAPEDARLCGDRWPRA
jgi:hypothetical protein